MQARVWIFAMLTMVMLAGCQTTGDVSVVSSSGRYTGTGPHTCVFDPCRAIHVWIDESTKPPKINVDIPTMKMYTRNQGALIRWVLEDSQNYEFREGEGGFHGPIIFKGKGMPSAPRQFTRWVVTKNFVSTVNANSDRQDYEYTVRVYRKPTPANPNPTPAYYELDPAIVNDY